MGYNPSRSLLIFRFLKPLTVRSYGGLNNGKNIIIIIISIIIIIIIIIIIAMGKVGFLIQTVRILQTF